MKVPLFTPVPTRKKKLREEMVAPASIGVVVNARLGTDDS